MFKIRYTAISFILVLCFVGIMSCSDSDSPDKENTIDVSNMGDVIGKEADEAETEEVSSEIPEISSEREDADGAPSSDDQGAASVENQIYEFDVCIHFI